MKVTAAGTTGSGRYLTGDFIGADTIQNEITAQATAAIAYDPTVDTIFEIGGQDSKYISIENGVVVDFEMNKVCAAGTGSFLQEQAEKLNINIIEEFGSLALQAKQPAALGDRCTVFMESDLNTHQQKGVSKEKSRRRPCLLHRPELHSESSRDKTDRRQDLLSGRRNQQQGRGRRI